MWLNSHCLPDPGDADIVEVSVQGDAASGIDFAGERLRGVWGKRAWRRLWCVRAEVPGALPTILSLGGGRPAIYGHCNSLSRIVATEGIGAASQGDSSAGLNLTGDNGRLKGDGQLA